MGFWLAGWLYGNIPTLWIMVMTSGLESAGEILLTLCFSYQTHTFAFYSQLTWISTVITARGAKWQKVSQISSHISQGGGGGGGEWGGQIGKLFSLECAAAVLAGDETLSVRLWCDVTPLSLPPSQLQGTGGPPPSPLLLSTSAPQCYTSSSPLVVLSLWFRWQLFFILFFSSIFPNIYWQISVFMSKTDKCYNATINCSFAYLKLIFWMLKLPILWYL